MLSRYLAPIGMACLLAGPSIANQSCTRDAMLVFDGSGSMSELGFNLLDEPRIFAARRAMRQAMPQITPVRDVGLLIYGPGPEGSCDNVDLRFPPQPDASADILVALDELQPSGDTPLTRSVKRAAEVLNYQNEPGIVVLVTDGKENCGGAPCELAAELIADAKALTVHVIGFKVRGEHFRWDSEGTDEYRNGTTIARCLADRTGGLYLSTETVEELATALQKTLGCLVIGRAPAVLPLRG